MICFSPESIRGVTVQAHTGRMDLNMHVGSAVRKGCMFLLFQYLRIIKLTKIIKYFKKKKKASWHCQPIPIVVLEILIL